MVKLNLMPSLQERRFNADYNQLKIKFIADHYSLLKDPESGEIDLKDNVDVSKFSPFSIVSLKVINRLDPEKNRGKEKLDIDSKFKLLNLASRAEIMQYDNDKCNVRIKQLLTEASKLDTPWRKKAIEELLEKYKAATIDATNRESVKTSLYEAAYIRDGHFDNAYYKSQIAKTTISYLNWVLVTLVSIILISSAIFEFALHKQFLLGKFSDLWIVVIFGLLGAAFSTLLNLYKGNRLSTNIIKALDSFILTVARLIIGASAGLIAFYLLNSGLIVIKGFNEETLKKFVDQDQSLGPKPLELSMLALIFVAGFTERFVINFVEKISNQQQVENKPQPVTITPPLVTNTQAGINTPPPGGTTQIGSNTPPGSNTQAENNPEEEDKPETEDMPDEEEDKPKPGN